MAADRVGKLEALRLSVGALISEITEAGETDTRWAAVAEAYEASAPPPPPEPPRRVKCPASMADQGKAHECVRDLGHSGDHKTADGQSWWNRRFGLAGRRGAW